MTQKPGVTRTLSTILKNSATTSTQQVEQLEKELRDLRTLVEQQQIELLRLRKMELWYRPPNESEHLKLTEALNQLWNLTHRQGDAPMSFIKSKGIPSPEDIG